MTQTQTQTAPSPTRLERMAATYREEHRNPINHVLHVGVGWPLAAIAVIAAPFKPLLGLELFVLAYLVMWTGHFVFERNLPTVFRHPTTPFVMAWSVIRQIVAFFARLVPGASKAG